MSIKDRKRRKQGQRKGKLKTIRIDKGILVYLIVSIISICGMVFYLKSDHMEDNLSAEEAQQLVGRYLDELFKYNAHLNIKTSQDVYNTWYNHKGEAYSVDSLTNYVFRNDGKMIYYTISTGLVGRSVVKNQKDYVSAMKDEIGTATKVQASAGKVDDIDAFMMLYKLPSGVKRFLVIREYGNGHFGMMLSTVIDNQAIMSWSFDDFTETSDWELDPEWYSNSASRMELLADLIQSMDKKLMADMAESTVPTMGIKIKDYVEMSAENKTAIYEQTKKEMSLLGFEATEDYTEDWLNEMLNSLSDEQMEYFDNVLGYAIFSGCNEGIIINVSEEAEATEAEETEETEETSETQTTNEGS